LVPPPVRIAESFANTFFTPRSRPDFAISYIIA